MVSLWVIIGLIISAAFVSTMGALFSVLGLGELFSGAVLAVSMMAGALEFSKFILAAYLHQRWHHLRIIFKSYLVSAIVILSCITSMGIFGFLSNAYQSASSQFDSENIKLNSIKSQQASKVAEIARLNKSIDEIPETRLSKKLKLRSELEPAINELNKQLEELEQKSTQANLQLLEVKQKVGPLIYISKMFNIDIDIVVKYLILLFVSVFDPLAICLVIATSEALESRKNRIFHAPISAPLTTQPVTQPVAQQPAKQEAQQANSAPSVQNVAKPEPIAASENKLAAQTSGSNAVEQVSAQVSAQASEQESKVVSGEDSGQVNTTAPSVSTSVSPSISTSAQTDSSMAVDQAPAEANNNSIQDAGQTGLRVVGGNDEAALGTQAPAASEQQSEKNETEANSPSMPVQNFAGPVDASIDDSDEMIEMNFVDDENDNKGTAV